jgi:hypothetical protein
MQDIIGPFGPNALKGKKVQLQMPITFSSKIQNDAKLNYKFIILKISTTLMLEVFSFGACIIKTEGLEHWPNLETLPFMFCTLHFKLQFHQFPHLKWIFSQHNNCSLHQNLSNHYSHDHVWIWQMVFSKRRSFWFNYA